VTVGFGLTGKEKTKEKIKNQERVSLSREGAKGDGLKESISAPAPTVSELAPSTAEQPPSPTPSLPNQQGSAPIPPAALSPPAQPAAFFHSIQRPTLSRSSTKSQHAPKLSHQETAYLRKLLADTIPANPFARFKPQVVGGSDSGQNMWLKLGQLSNVEECLRMFTAVENLQGENSVACRRCWKIANGLYKPRPPPEHVDVESPDSESEEEVEPTVALNGMTSAETHEPLHPQSTPATPTRSRSSSTSYSSARSMPTELSSQPNIPSLAVNGGAIDHHDPPPASAPPGGFTIPLISTTEPHSPTREPSPPVGARGSLQAPPRWVKVPRPIGEATDDSRDESDGFDSDTSAGTSTSSDDGSTRLNGSVAVGLRQVVPLPSHAQEGSGSDHTSISSRVPRSKQVIMRPAYKRYLIASAPPVLIIHLKRFQQISRTHVISFSHGFKKLDDYVAFPEYLDLGPFLTPRKEDFGLRKKKPVKGGKVDDSRGAAPDPCKYRLYAVVVHIGNIVRKFLSCSRESHLYHNLQLGGHYIAYVALPPPPTPSSSPDAASAPKPSGANNPNSDDPKPTPGRQWAYVSDTVVRLTTLEEVLKAKAYICMYERL
jgi:hypothetical protein